MCSSLASGSLDGGGPPPRPTTTAADVKMRRFTLPNLFLTVEGQDRKLEEICPGIYEYTGHRRSTRSPKSPKSPRSPKSVKSSSPMSPRGGHCHCHCTALPRQDDQGSSTAPHQVLAGSDHHTVTYSSVTVNHQLGTFWLPPSV
nr:uncharacterized protein LOC128688020 [Cherax quadricarinatus]